MCNKIPKRQKDEPLYKWIERVADWMDRKFVLNKGDRDIILEGITTISKASYIEGVHAAIKS